MVHHGVTAGPSSYNGKDPAQESASGRRKGHRRVDKAPSRSELLELVISTLYREKSKALQAVGKNAEPGRQGEGTIPKQAIELPGAGAAKPRPPKIRAPSRTREVRYDARKHQREGRNEEKGAMPIAIGAHS